MYDAGKLKPQRFSQICTLWIDKSMARGGEAAYVVKLD